METLVGWGLAILGALVAREIARQQKEQEPQPEPVPVRNDNPRRQ